MTRLKLITVLTGAALVLSATAAGSGWLVSSIHQIKPSVRAKLRGPRGYRGFQGSQGQPGNPGTFNTQNIQILTGQTTAIGPQSAGYSLATCPPGGIPIGGGLDGGSAPPINSSITEDQPLYSSWEVVLVNNDPNLSATVTAVAVCATARTAAIARAGDAERIAKRNVRIAKRDVARARGRR